VPAAPALPTPAVIFSAPANGELDANPSSVVRVQFSRDMNAASFDRHITVTYGPGTTEAPPKFTVTSRPGNMAIEITFEAPLARFSSVTIELGEGITTRDGAPFPPTRITFTTGG
jgi:hypothetical protein